MTLEEIENRFRERENRRQSGDTPVPTPKESGAPVIPVEPQAEADHTESETPPVDTAPATQPDYTIEQLQEQLEAERHARAAIQGRLAPTQQDLDNMRQLLKQQQERDAKQAAELEELRRQLSTQQQQDSQAAVRQAVLEAMSEEERAEYDEGFIDLVSRIGYAAAQRVAPQIDVQAEVASALKRQEDERLQEYRAQVITDPKSLVSKLQTISNDASFIAWLEDNPDLNYHIDGLAFSRTTKDINKFAKSTERHLKAYFDHIAPGTKPTRTEDPTPTGGGDLERAMDRRHSGQRSPQDTARLQQQIADLSRSRNPDDRAKALDLIQQL